MSGPPTGPVKTRAELGVITGKKKTLYPGKIVVGGLIIGADTNDLSTGILKDLVIIPETACFFCTTVGFILRVKKQYDCFISNKL